MVLRYKGITVSKILLVDQVVISNHLFQSFTTAEIIRHKFSCSEKATKNISHIQVHFCSYYFPVASDHLFKAHQTTQRQAIVGFDKKNTAK